MTVLVLNKDKYKKISGISDHLFEDFEMDEGVITYNPQTLLEDKQVYSIEKFSNTKYCLEILTETINSTDFNEYEKGSPKEWLIDVADDKFYFQKVTNRLMQPMKLLRFWDKQNSFEVVNSDDHISVNKFPDAIYDREKDVLFFKKLERIKTLFPDIEELYREATNQEVESFMSQEFIEMDEKFSSSKVKVQNRKRIALLYDLYESYTPEEQKKLKSYVRKYVQDLPVNDDKFIISTNKDLQKLLYGIDQRYYTTEIRNQKRMANSVVNISE
ncbi:hypothetical protein [Fructobacillus cardui]|uniref:hypothetical protein n=1 Tax=Fructobacillus cardui TaxID=2893170 RepID=UPI002DB192D7|nr:hypothetical protein R53653_IHELHDKM_01418 [Fructobacillus cardui]